MKRQMHATAHPERVRTPAARERAPRAAAGRAQAAHGEARSRPRLCAVSGIRPRCRLGRLAKVGRLKLLAAWIGPVWLASSLQVGTRSHPRPNARPQPSGGKLSAPSGSSYADPCPRSSCTGCGALATRSCCSTAPAQRLRGRRARCGVARAGAVPRAFQPRCARPRSRGRCRSKRCSPPARRATRAGCERFLSKPPRAPLGPARAPAPGAANQGLS